MDAVGKTLTVVGSVLETHKALGTRSNVMAKKREFPLPDDSRQLRMREIVSTHVATEALPFEPKFPMVLDAVNLLKPRSTILGGEIVALDAECIPRFQLLQQWQKRPTAPVVFHRFDVLWNNDSDLTGKTVLQRRERLAEIITPVSGIQVGGYIENRGKELFALAKEKGLEGIIAKRQPSIYRPGKRSPDWLKVLIELTTGQNESSVTW